MFSLMIALQYKTINRPLDLEEVQFQLVIHPKVKF